VHRRLLQVVLGLGLGLPGCSPSDGGEADAATPVEAGAGDGPGCLFCSDATIDASLEVRVKGKIDQICANADGCHGQGSGGMSLLPGAEFDAMIDVSSTEVPTMKRVVPGDPANSYVYVKLACDGGIPAGFACMPLSTGFDPQLAQLFHDWIEAGAPTQ
jgi:hypothetical protein